MASAGQARIAGSALARTANAAQIARMEHLRAWRKARGWTLEQLASIIGQHFTTVQKWEKGLRAVDMDDVAKLAKAFGVTPVALFFAPTDLDLARRIGRAMDILAKTDPSAADAWLQIGDRLPAPVEEPKLDEK
jgi:transcriptional regulator with XRE-family HTH domain